MFYEYVFLQSELRKLHGTVQKKAPRFEDRKAFFTTGNPARVSGGVRADGLR